MFAFVSDLVMLCVTSNTEYVNMADVPARINPLFLRDEELRQGIELLYFAYREFTNEADAILSDQGLGRAHHRVIYFVGRQPGISVSDLLSTLRITKQSLSRVLSQLLKDDFIDQKPGLRDRRQRLLTLSPKGVELERQLTENQRKLLARAYREAGAEAVEGFRKVMLNIMNEDDRGRFPAQTTPPLPGWRGGPA
jgi:DNA-binding MarR family transcriptional regulator